jgi:hypothetical protein
MKGALLYEKRRGRWGIDERTQWNEETAVYENALYEEHLSTIRKTTRTQ